MNSPCYLTLILVNLLVALTESCKSTSSREGRKIEVNDQSGGQRNIFGNPLEICSTDPMTGWFRDGTCRTDDNDRGTHTVCATMTEEVIQCLLSCLCFWACLSSEMTRFKS